MPAKFKDPLWYLWAVNYRNKRGRIQQLIVEAPTHADAVAAAAVDHPGGFDFTAQKISTRPLR
jgi:hypothetical protein